MTKDNIYSISKDTGAGSRSGVDVDAVYTSTDGDLPEKTPASDLDFQHTSRTPISVTLPPHFRYRFIQSLVVYIAFFFLGMKAGVFGPTLLDLQLTANTDTRSISYIFISSGVGGLLAAILTGVLIERVNKWLILVVAELFLILTIVAVPWMPDVYSLVALCGLSGMAAGLVDAGGTIIMLNIWVNDNESWLQLLHCTFSAGVVIAPLAARPFLAENPEQYESTTPDQLVTGAVDQLVVLDSIHTDIWKVYLITACGCTFALVSLMFVYCRMPIRQAKDHEALEPKENKQLSISDSQQSPQTEQKQPHSTDSKQSHKTEQKQSQSTDSKQPCNTDSKLKDSKQVGTDSKESPGIDSKQCLLGDAAQPPRRDFFENSLRSHIHILHSLYSNRNKYR